MTSGLPAAFADLERFVEKWDRPNSNSRYAQRLASSMTEMDEFYRAMLKRAEEIKVYLDQKPFEAYSEMERRLARLMFAMTIVGQAIEVYRQPKVPDSGGTSLTYLDELELN